MNKLCACVFKIQESLVCVASMRRASCQIYLQLKRNQIFFSENEDVEI